MIESKRNKTRSRALKSLLKSKEVKRIIDGLAEALNLKIAIQNADDQLLYGDPHEGASLFPIQNGQVDLGAVLSDHENGALIRDLLQSLIQKDLEKKKIGNEVLGLYREINMIYDFSETLSEKIETEAIAQMTLNEAAQIIDSSHGLCLLYQPEDDRVVVMSSFGHNPMRDQNIHQQNELLKEVIKRGTSAIVDQERIVANPALQHLKAAMYAPLKVKNKTLGMVMLGRDQADEFKAGELKLLTTLALQAAVAIEGAQLYEKGLKAAQEREQAIKAIHQVSQKFVPKEFIKSLGKDHLTEVSLGDLTEKEVSVMFVDIRGFTSLSEKLTPRENFLFINSFNKRMGPIIRQHQGFIMQYLGDGYMALFPNGSQDALRAAVEVHMALESYNEDRLAKGRLPVKVGIGMQNGDLIMGITGDVERLDAAIISDTVNTASRIEGLSKHFGTSILITGECKDKLQHPEEFDFRFLGPVQVIGKQKSIELYECFNGDAEDLYKHKLESLSTFNKGMELYFNREFAMAAVTFQKVYKKNPQDLTAKLFLNKAAQLITKEIEGDWSGIQAMTSK